MLVDPSKTAFENMLAMLNLTNGTEYTVEDVSFGPPVIYSDAAHPDYNTKVVLSGIGDYSGTMDIFYKRLDLDREIMYRNYEGGSFANVAAFMAFVEERNEIRGDNVRLELAELPDGTVEVTTRILPIADSWLYMGDREIIFRVSDEYVPPVADPAQHYDIDVPAGTLNDGKQVFASNARVVGSIEFVAAGTVVDYTFKPDYDEVVGKSYPMAVLLNEGKERLAVLGRTYMPGRQRYTRMVRGGEAPFTTARTIRALAADARVIQVPQPATALKTVWDIEEPIDTRSYGFGADGLGPGVDMNDGLRACLRITRIQNTQLNTETHELNFSITDGSLMVDGQYPSAAVWATLGERVLGGVEFLDAAGVVIFRIDAPTYGVVASTPQTGFWDVLEDIASFRVEMVSIV